MSFKEFRPVLEMLVGAGDFVSPTQRALLEELMFGTNKNVVVSVGSLGGKTTAVHLAGILHPTAKYLVFCPSVALINQQLASLNHISFEGRFSAVSLSGEDVRSNRAEISRIINELELKGDSIIKFVFITPEIIVKSNDKEKIQSLINDGAFTDVIIDDAYFDTFVYKKFRPNSVEFKELRQKNLNIRWVIMSTLNDADIERINANMRMGHPKIIRSPTYERKDIFYKVVSGSPKDDIESLLENGYSLSGLLFTHYRQDTEDFVKEFSENKMTPPAKSYHGESENRTDVVNEWRNGEFPLLVATCDSFRWGIVKNPLDFVFHSMHPKSLRFYYRESGRARGIEKKTVDARLYKNQKTNTSESFHNNIPDEVLSYISTEKCRHKYLLEECFGEIIEPCGNRCDNCVNSEQQ